MALSFAPSEFGTLGLEFEATVIDSVTGSPLAVASRIAGAAQPGLARGLVSPDLFESTLEYTTGICRTIDEARQDLVSIHERVRPYLDDCGGRLLGMGLHPQVHPRSLVDVSTPNYEDLISRLQWTARQIVATGIHVHVGMSSGDQAISVAGALRSFMPVLLALSASSPFKEGGLTGLASTRMAVFGCIPRSGPMPHFDDWSEYEAFCDVMARTDSMATPRSTWWDCRPQAPLGTLEIRIMDSVPDLEDVLALGALAWCLAVATDELSEFIVGPRISDENRWRAIRGGSAAHLLVSDAGDTQPVGVVVERLVNALSGTGADLGCTVQLERCVELGWGRARYQRLAPVGDYDDVATLIDDALISMQVTW